MDSATPNPHRVPALLLATLGVIDLVRGAFHWLAPDSGAHLIAGMDLHGPSGSNIVFLLATDGVGQIAWGILYLVVALRERKLLRLMFLLEAFKSAAVLFTEYVTKPPVPHVPGRFMHAATLSVSVAVLLFARNPKEHSA
jgi:hypothetical protein